jgi:hypothetical protein
MTLKEKYPDFKLVHFIEMYDNLISIESHALNAMIFEDQKYISSILKELNELKQNNELNLILTFMKLCGWTNEDEISVIRIKKELESVKNLSND